jgi:cell division topological specificity factor
VLNTLRKLFTGRAADGNSKSLAKSRLSFVLVQDRTGLTPEEMTKFKKELVGVIEKYFQIDEDGFDIAYKRETDSTTLLINSPVVVRRLKKDREASKKTSSGSSETTKSEDSTATAAIAGS